MGKSSFDTGVNVADALIGIGVTATLIATGGGLAPVVGGTAGLATLAQFVFARVVKHEQSMAKAIKSVSSEQLPLEWSGAGDPKAQWDAVARQVTELLTREQNVLAAAVNDPYLPDMKQQVMARGGSDLIRRLELGGGGIQIDIARVQLDHAAEYLESMRDGTAPRWQLLWQDLSDIKQTLTSMDGKLDEITAAVAKGDFARYVDDLKSMDDDDYQMLDYRSGMVGYFGRDRELTRLHRFCETSQQPDVLWAAITGPGGTGKSRLALQLCQELGPNWEWLFLEDTFFQNPATAFTNWDYPKHLLIVVDYLTGRAQQVGRWICELAGPPKRSHSIRILLLDRDEFASKEDSDSRLEADNSPYWYRQLTSGSGRRAADLHYREGSGPCVISLSTDESVLSADTMKDILLSIQLPETNTTAKLHRIPESDVTSIIDRLADIDPEHSRPLYLLLVARIWLADPVTAPQNTETREGLLNTIYEHEVSMIQKACEKAGSEFPAETVLDLWAWATATGVVESVLELPEASYAASVRDNSVLPGSFRQFADLVRGCVGSLTVDVVPYTPDIPGEYLTLRRVHSVVQTADSQRFVTSAWTNAPGQFIRFLARACADFGRHTASSFESLLVPGQGLLQPPTGDSDPASSHPHIMYCVGLSKLVGVVAPEVASNALQPLRELHESRRDDEALSIVLSEALFRLSSNVPDLAQEIIEGELKELADQFSDNVEINSWLARGLFTLSVFVPKLAQGIVEGELKVLAGRFPDDAEISLPWALGLVNLSVFVPDLAQEIVGGELAALAGRFPDDAEINLQWARGLYYLSGAMPELARGIVGGELRELAGRFADDAEISLQWARGLANLAATMPELARGIVGGELRELAGRFPDNAEINLPWAIGLLNLSGAMPELMRGIVGGELRELAGRFPDDAEINLRWAKGLFNLSTAVPELAQGIVGGELKVVAGRFPGHAEINLEWAKGLLNVSVNVPELARGIVGGELRELAGRFPEDEAINLQWARGLVTLSMDVPELARGIVGGELRELAGRFPEDEAINLWWARSLISLSLNVPELALGIVGGELAALAARFPGNVEINELLARARS